MRRAAQFARRFPYALKCDVQKYFPSIDHDHLMRLVARVIGDQRLLELIGKVLGTHTACDKHGILAVIYSTFKYAFVDCRLEI